MNVMHMMQVRERVAAGAFPLNKFVITKQLTKRPEDYPDAKNQPHVQVALRRKAAGAQNGVMQVHAPSQLVYSLTIRNQPARWVWLNCEG